MPHCFSWRWNRNELARGDHAEDAEPHPVTVRPARPRRRPQGRPADSRHDRTLALLLWGWAATLVALHAALPWQRTTWAWSLDLQRDLHPLPAWGLWVLTAAVLIPAVARRLEPPLTRVGHWIARAPVWSSLILGAAAAAIVLTLPDRVQFVGDFLLRQSTLRESVEGSTWYPQALPLDLLVHERLARWVMQALGLDANGAGRAIGAVEVGMLGALALHLARVLDLRGAAAVAVAAVAFWGGSLTLFTGYNKAFSEMCLLTCAVGVFGLDVVRRGRGLLPLGMALTLALLLHRSALGLIPAVGVACWSWFRRAPQGRPHPVALVAAGAPLVALAIVAPRILTIMRTFDPIHFAPEGARGAGVLVATFSPARAADLLNLLVMLSPLAAALPPLLLLRAGELRRPEIAFTLALALPFVAIAPLIHPGQGYFRDWDVVAAAGVALSIGAAWWVGGWLSAASDRRWLAATVIAAVAVPSLQWMILQTDLEHGLGRARAFATQPPARTSMERYTVWQYLGVRLAADEQLEQAAAAYQHAAAIVPSPHILHQWAAVELERGNSSGARTVYRRLLADHPTDTFGWWALAVASSRLGDWSEAHRAARRVLELDSAHVEARQAVEEMERMRPDLGSRR
jgi:tetratricopeptide (TPR) repeat protein